LPEIGTVFRSVPARRHVEQADAPDGRIDREALGGVPGATEITLKDVIYRDGRLAEVADEVVDAVSNATGYVVFVAPRNGLQRVVIDELVPGENGPIGRFRRSMGASRQQEDRGQQKAPGELPTYRGPRRRPAADGRP
jgi:hypothetical protein